MSPICLPMSPPSFDLKHVLVEVLIDLEAKIFLAIFNHLPLNYQ